MARATAVWGIDIGQCALKALRCRRGDNDSSIVADAFDFIEYPKILSQPEANPEELIKEAFTQFLSRNSVRGDQVAISVPGQAGLARFIKLPPVESKKIPDIVKYEARQQIPFALEDVVWDYQQMAGGSEEDGFALETEVGLFAMKREQVAKALAPFKTAGIEVDYVQLTPLALYNFVAFDQLQDLPPPEEYDPDNPPESLVLLSLGTDTTDLVVTNGYRVWQRSIPLGGSHFTKALTKEMKLTFAKAEHLKRNAAQADDPRAVFQAMRPVFNDLVTEVQRSISYFTNIDRRAKIQRILGLGNAMKLPGLQRFLTQQLGMEVVRLESFRGMSGEGVVNAPAFKENLLSFGTCYGLALQGLADTRIRTNLVPPELVKERLIRSKKPWAVGAAAVLLLGLSLRSVRDWQAVNTVDQAKFGSAISAATQVKSESSKLTGDFEAAKGAIFTTGAIGTELIQGVESRDLWLEFLGSVAACFPVDSPEDPKEPLKDRIPKRTRLYVTRMDCAPQAETALWFDKITVIRAQEQTATPAEGGDASAAPAETPPSGPGYVLHIEGYHYHNNERDNMGPEYVRRTLLKNLREDQVDDPNHPGEKLDVRRLGIIMPTLLPNPKLTDQVFDDPDAAPRKREGESGTTTTTASTFTLKRYDFVIQFVWKPIPKELRVAPTPPAGSEEQAPTDETVAGGPAGGM
jgi:type IV pilus assembly protein PilM